jgi:thymidine phosphorylase
VLCLAKPGERVERGQPLLELLTDDESRFGRAEAALAGAVTVGGQPPDAPPLVIDRL